MDQDFPSEPEEAEKIPYEPPRVLTFRGDEMLRLLGPAQACSVGHSVVCATSPLDPWTLGQPSW
jgi:hypothetical protein